MHTILAAAAVAATLQPHTPLPADLEAAARHQLYAACSAFGSTQELESWSCGWCKHIPVTKVFGVVNHVKHESQGYVARTSSEIYVAFRGSSNTPNWISDLTFDKIRLRWDGVPKGIEVHQGFLHSYEAMRPNITAWVKQAVAECPTCTVRVTGHSLGAAQAVLCVTDLRLLGLKPEMWNFGLPRVGGKAFAEWFDAQTQGNGQTLFHMTNKRDIVPHLPPSDLFYHHISREVWRALNGTYVVCDGGEDPECARSVPFFKRTGADHTPYMDICP